MRNVVIRENVSFKELNKIIEKEGVELVIAIKNPERLEQRRPILLYNVFEWMNATQSRQHLRFVLVTREISFVDEREKRVKSRMNIPVLYCSRPRV